LPSFFASSQQLARIEVVPRVIAKAETRVINLKFIVVGRAILDRHSALREHRLCLILTLSSPHQQHRDGRIMPNLVNGASKNQISKEPVAVACHGDQIAFFISRTVNNFSWRVAERQFDSYNQSFSPQFGRDLFEIPPVIFHLFRFGQFELVKMPRRPTIRDMDKDQLRPKLARQFRDVWHEAQVRAAIFEGN
jgi:hypothetical protein